VTRLWHNLSTHVVYKMVVHYFVSRGWARGAHRAFVLRQGLVDYGSECGTAARMTLARKSDTTNNGPVIHAKESGSDTTMPTSDRCVDPPSHVEAVVDVRSIASVSPLTELTLLIASLSNLK